VSGAERKDPAVSGMALDEGRARIFHKLTRRLDLLGGAVRNPGWSDPSGVGGLDTPARFVLWRE
jgi:hypothetical protein